MLKIAQEMTYRIYNEFYEDLAERQEDGNFIVTVSWPEDDRAYGTIQFYGEHIEVIEPEYINEIIKENNKNNKNIYNMTCCCQIMCYIVCYIMLYI